MGANEFSARPRDIGHAYAELRFDGALRQRDACRKLTTQLVCKRREKRGMTGRRETDFHRSALVHFDFVWNLREQRIACQFDPPRTQFLGREAVRQRVWRVREIRVRLRESVHRHTIREYCRLKTAYAGAFPTCQHTSHNGVKGGTCDARPGSTTVARERCGAQLFDIPLAQQFHLTLLELGCTQRTDRDAFELAHLQADARQHASDLAILALAQGDAE